MSEVLLNGVTLLLSYDVFTTLNLTQILSTLFVLEQSFGRSLMMSWCVLTVQLPAAALRGVERRGTAYAGMDLQPSAKDCIRLWYGGREGKKRTGVGGKLSETKRARIARRPPNRVSCEGRSEESLELSKLCLHLILQKQPS